MVLHAIYVSENIRAVSDMKAVIADGGKLTLLCRYLSERVDCTFEADSSQGFAIISEEGVFFGGVVVSNIRFHEGKPVDCEVSIGVESPIALKPEPMRAIFDYIFNQLGCVRCTAITKKNNTKARSFLEAFKFELEGKVRKGYDGERDALIYGLLAEDCPFLEA